MLNHMKRLSPAFILMLLTACGGLARCSTAQSLNQEAFDALYEKPLSRPTQPLRVYHIGHSLVGRDMPAMLAQLVGSSHRYEIQLGWGTSLKSHWEPDVEINGFAVENDHPRYRDANEAVSSGDYDVLILTESVEIRDSIRYNDSAEYLRRWASAGWQANPELRVYLYETWHERDDAEGWLNRLDLDLTRYWEDGILRPALAHDNITQPIYVIPAGQVLARFVRAVETQGGTGSVHSRDDLFALASDGTRDQIHLSDIGAYLVALTHYATLYHQSPVGLPYELLLADGAAADAPDGETALLMQQIVWDVVNQYPRTGVAKK